MPSDRAEPTIEQLLDDPIADLLLARDGLTRADVLAVIESARANMRQANVGRMEIPLKLAA